MSVKTGQAQSGSVGGHDVSLVDVSGAEVDEGSTATRRRIAMVQAQIAGRTAFPSEVTWVITISRGIQSTRTRGHSRPETAAQQGDAKRCRAGEDLMVAETTVKTHVNRVLAKLGIRTRVQAMVLAYETGFVRPGGSS
jgi:hypothetical protein